MKYKYPEAIQQKYPVMGQEDRYSQAASTDQGSKFQRFVFSLAAVLSLTLLSLPISGTAEAQGQHKKHYSWPEDQKPDRYKYRGDHAKRYSWPDHYKGHSWPKHHKKGKSWYKDNDRPRHKKHYSWPHDQKPDRYKYKGDHAKSYSWPDHYKGHSWPKHHKKGKSWYKDNDRPRHKKHYSWPHDQKPEHYKYRGDHAKRYSWPDHDKGHSWPKAHEKGKSWYQNDKK